MDAAVAALLGAAIGVVGTLGSMWIQQKHQTRRELVKTAVELAEADYARMLEDVSKHPGARKPPIAIYVAYHVDILRAIADGTFGPDTVSEMEAKLHTIMEVVPVRNRPA